MQRHRGLLQDHEPVRGVGQNLSEDQGLPASCSMQLNGQVIGVRATAGDPVDDHGHACRGPDFSLLLIVRRLAEGDAPGFGAAVRGVRWSPGT